MAGGMKWQATVQRGVVVGAAVTFLAGCSATPPAAAAEPVAAAEAATISSATTPQTLESLGVEVVAVNLSASDFMIDLRYRVKNIDRAQALLDRKVQPVLINEVTGDRFYVPNTPKLGALRQTQRTKQAVQLDRVYFMLFANPDRKLKVGEKVTLYAGDSVLHDLVVKR